MQNRHAPLLLSSIIALNVVVFLLPLAVTRGMAAFQHPPSSAAGAVGVIREWPIGHKYLAYSDWRPLQLNTDHTFTSGLPGLSGGKWEELEKGFSLHTSAGETLSFRSNGSSWETFLQRSSREIPFYLEVRLGC